MGGGVNFEKNTPLVKFYEILDKNTGILTCLTCSASRIIFLNKQNISNLLKGLQTYFKPPIQTYFKPPKGTADIFKVVFSFSVTC